MAKLHQLLAVDKDVETAARKIRSESIVTFTKRTDHFSGHLKTLEFFDDARSHEADALQEEKAITTTVPERLNYTADFLIRHLDCLAQKEATNQRACADLVIGDGDVLLSDVPATTLLALERELKNIREMYDVIPTLAPGIEWQPDVQTGDNIWKAVEPKRAHRTEKKLHIISLAKATKEHKEQVSTQTVDVPVGQWTTQVWSGLISPKAKADVLKRIDELIRAVKNARAKANEQEIVPVSVGRKLFEYINAPLNI